MRLQIFSIFLALSISAHAQTENIPTSIKIVSYLGGDYRHGEFLGAYDQIDSLVYTWNDKMGNFVSDTIYNIHEIREFKNMDFSQNQNSNSLLKRPILSWIDKREISELLKEIDSLSYKREEIIDTLFSDQNKIERIERFPCNVSRQYSIESFGYSYETFSCLCNQNRKNSSSCNDTTAIYTFLNQLLIDNVREIPHTGHMKYIEITLNFKTHSIILRQTDPGGHNMAWTNDKYPMVRLINPKLNLIAYKLEPKFFAQRQRLLEFKENITDIFLQK
jgi:hypothetical protein